MSAPAIIRREHLNCRFYFIPSGETVATVATSKTTWPAAGTAGANWLPYNFPDIEKVTAEVEVETEAFMIPNDTGGYTKDTEEQVTMRKWKLTTSKTNTYLKKLEHATVDTPAAGTAEMPGTKNDNFILGVALFEFQNKSGYVTERWQIWGKLRIVTAGEVGPKTRAVEFSFEQQDSANNTYVLLIG